MAEENKVMKSVEASEKAKGTDVKVSVAENVVVEQTKKMLKVEREKFVSKDKKEYFGYFIKGQLRGRDIRVDLEAKGSGGYEVLDLIFGDDSEAFLRVNNEVAVDDNGNKTRYSTYEVVSFDPDGFEYSYKVKPSRESDKAQLNMLLAKLANSDK